MLHRAFEQPAAQRPSPRSAAAPAPVRGGGGGLAGRLGAVGLLVQSLPLLRLLTSSGELSMAQDAGKVPRDIDARQWQLAGAAFQRWDAQWRMPGTWTPGQVGRAVRDAAGLQARMSAGSIGPEGFTAQMTALVRRVGAEGRAGPVGGGAEPPGGGRPARPAAAPPELARPQPASRAHGERLREVSDQSPEAREARERERWRQAHEQAEAIRQQERARVKLRPPTDAERADRTAGIADPWVRHLLQGGPELRLPDRPGAGAGGVRASAHGAGGANGGPGDPSRLPP